MASPFHTSRRAGLPTLCAFLIVVLAAGCRDDRQAPESARPDTAAPPPAGTAYTSVDIPNGGTITGTVQWTGKRPELPSFDITSDANACASASRNNRLEIGSDGGVRWAVVYLDDVKQGKPMPAFPPESLLVDQQGCQYTPHVLAAPVGSLVTFLNSDDIAHNVRVEHALSDSLLLNRTQPMRGRSDRLLVDRPGPATVGCDYHPWMNAYVFGVANPYFAVTDADGSFTIDRVPPGTYTLKLWFNGYRTLPKRDNQGRTVGYGFGDDHTDGQSIVVPAGGTAQADFKIAP